MEQAVCACRPTPAPTSTPTPAPTPTPTPAPTMTPTPAPTSTPTPAPTSAPTSGPSYVYGTAGSNTCPAGSTRITDSDVCQYEAAVALGIDFMGTGFDTDPKGCYKGSSDAYMNNHATGGTACSYCQLICLGAAVTTTPAPTFAPSPAPTSTPTAAPTSTPSPAPSSTPTPAPSSTPTPAPTAGYACCMRY